MAFLNHVACAVVLITFPLQGFADCPNGFYKHDQSCYRFFTTVKATWVEAMMYCKLFSAHLARIESEREQNFVEGYLRREYTRGLADGVWIDGTDALVEGEWVWMNDGNPTDITPSSYQKWGPGEPNSLGHGEDCMDLEHHEGYNWNDDDCNRLQPFLCEMSSFTGGDIIG